MSFLDYLLLQSIFFNTFDDKVNLLNAFIKHKCAGKAVTILDISHITCFFLQNAMLSSQKYYSQSKRVENKAKIGF